MKPIVLSYVLLTSLTFFVGCGGGSSKGPDLAAEKAKALKMSDPVARSHNLVTVADRQRKVGDVMGAKSTLSAAEDAAQTVEEPASKARSLVQIAASRLRGGDLVDGGNTLKQAEKAVDGIVDPAAKAEVLAEMAGAYQAESPDKANYMLSQAKDEVEKVTDPEQKGLASVRVAAALVKADKKEAAQTFIDAAADLARPLEDMRRRADALADAAILELKLDAEKGAALLTEAKAAADGADSPYTQAHAHLSIAKKLAAAGKKGDARTQADKSMDLSDKVGDSSLRSELKEQINKLKESL